MSSFFYHTAQTLLNQYTDRFPLLKITQLLDWQAIEQTLANHKVNYTSNIIGSTLYGKPFANDTLVGGINNDKLIGGIGDDILDGGRGNDKLFGGIGNDTLYGGKGNDKLSGESGDDVLYGGQGNDELIGGIGNDTYIFDLGHGKDQIYDSFGNDTLEFGRGIDKQNLWFSRQDNNLNIQVLDRNDSIVIKGWYNIIPRSIETIQTSDGYELDISAVQKLVQAMSTFQPQVTSGNVSQQMHQFMQQIQASSYWQQSENAGIL